MLVEINIIKCLCSTTFPFDYTHTLLFAKLSYDDIGSDSDIIDYEDEKSCY